MPIPATLTSYLPVLLVSVTNTVPDDTAYETQPEGQVDYLSHNWREEDVWRSWRSMTRQKNAIVNGMRLENASWRTWWKQRNKLKTISPETLNWCVSMPIHRTFNFPRGVAELRNYVKLQLPRNAPGPMASTLWHHWRLLKDSDVTWLYGPLHVGQDWQEMAHHEASHPAPHHDILTSRPITPLGKKPILKHRSITELLSLPASPLYHNDSDEELEELGHDDDPEHHSRPPLMHTKSDTHISWRARPFRKDSPPRIIASHHPEHGDHSHAVPSSSSSNTAGSDQDLSTGTDGSAGGKKKHISFNTFVEQCIAIEKPTPKRRGSSTHFAPTVNERYDDDSETGDDDDSDEPSYRYMNKAGGMDTDSEDDDDDDEEVLEMRSRSSSSSSSRPSAMRKLSPPTAASTRRPPLTRQSSIDRERVTIAPIPPTMLKTTGVGNSLGPINEDRSLSSQKEVELVYVPPTNSIYSHSNTPSTHHEDVYHHRESYFSVGTGPAMSHSRSADSSPVLNTFSLPPAQRDPHRQISHSKDLSQFFGQQIHDSPQQTDDVREEPEDAYDYFGGPDLGEDYHNRRPNTLRSRRSLPDVLDEDHNGGGIVRYGHGGASSVPTGRHSGSWSSPVSSSPRIVVNEVAGATEEREELSTGSSGSPSDSTRELPIPHRTPDTKNDADIPLAVSFIHNGPAVPVPVPRIVTHASPATDSPPETAYLSPTEAAVPARGRSPQCSPVSTTTGSYSLSSESRSESRGRASTRNSSFSDRERSGSRSSRGTSSPMGSISPTGSAIGIGGAYQVRGRDREGRTGVRVYRRGSLGAEDERGRDRTGRRIGDSLSPPSVIGSPARAPSDDFPAYSPVLDAKSTSSTASVSGSSVSGSSTASVATVTAHAGEDQGARAKGSSVSSRPLHIPIPSPIPEEEETRSRQPTPANSPVRALSSQQPPTSPTTATPTSPQHHHSHSPSSPLHVSPPAKSRLSEPVTSPSEAQATPGSPLHRTERHARSASEGQEHHHQQHGTLVGRAAEIVHSARGFLGAIWNAV
ncbi:hypothetical protein EIP86_009965 [Pleurotus ostreatoroseus]|nr:hypothetical protein EIP86_009965 [Pleurotus ostreatoroseus]